MHAKGTFTSPRRPAALACTPTPNPDTLRNRLESLLEAIPRAIDKASSGVENSLSRVPDQVQNLFSEDGALGALNFWRENRDEITEAGDNLRKAGEALVKGDTDLVRRHASAINLQWLRPRPSSFPHSRAENDIERRVRNAVLFLAESLTPWDFDRHDFGLTFANVWIDADSARSIGKDAVVKMTSTIKPLEKEWKVTARSKFLEFGEDGVAFGKAGLYLAGDEPAYIGMEVDKMWKVPKLTDTRVFINANYRSSRKPRSDPIRATIGVQQDLRISKGLDLSLRLGLNPLDIEDWYVTPVPNGTYF